MSTEVLSSVEVIADVLNGVVEMRRMSAGAECAGPLRGRVPA
jgi:hypothetical protein